MFTPIIGVPLPQLFFLMVLWVSVNLFVLMEPIFNFICRRQVRLQIHPSHLSSKMNWDCFRGKGVVLLAFISEPRVVERVSTGPFPQNTKSAPRVSYSQWSPKVSDVDEDVKQTLGRDGILCHLVWEVGATEGKLEEGMHWYSPSFNLKSHISLKIEMCSLYNYT